MPTILGAGDSDTGYEIDNGLVFNGVNQWMTHTRGTATDEKLFTFSAWVKVGQAGILENGTLFGAGDDGNGCRNAAQTYTQHRKLRPLDAGGRISRQDRQASAPSSTVRPHPSARPPSRRPATEALSRLWRRLRCLSTVYDRSGAPARRPRRHRSRVMRIPSRLRGCPCYQPWRFLRRPSRSGRRR